MTTGGEEAADLASSAGLDLDLWQLEVVDVIMAERPDGTWAARIIVVIVPRQNGKGSILEAVELTHLFTIPTSRLIIHSAHEFSTAQEHFERLIWLIDEAPHLQKLIAKNGVHHSKGSEGFTTVDGSRLLFRTRTGGGGRGFSGDLVVLDEAMILPPKAVSALVPTMSAMPNPQIIIAGSAPLDLPESDVLRGLALQGRAGDPDMAYMEWRAKEGSSLDDREAWQAANPGYPFRIGDRAIMAERVLMALDPEGFARERLGIWNEDPDEADKPIPTRYWVACERSHDPEKPALTEVAGPISISLDIPPSREWTHFAVCGKNGEGLDQGELAGRIPGTELAVGRAKELTDRYGCKLLIAKGSPAWSLEPDLIRAGVPLRPISTDEQSQASADFYDAVLAGTFAHLGDPLLTKAVDGAATRVYGDAWLWSRRKAGVDIAPLVAVTLARWGLVSPLVEERRKPIYAY